MGSARWWAFSTARAAVWQIALDRVLFLGCADLGLAPFLYWWHRMPFVPLYSVAVSFLAVGSLLFLASLNGLLRRLTAMLPDESLRQETRLFTRLNRALLGFVVASLLAYLVLSPWRGLPAVGRLHSVPAGIHRALDPPFSHPHAAGDDHVPDLEDQRGHLQQRFRGRALKPPGMAPKKIIGWITVFLVVLCSLATALLAFLGRIK